MDCYEAIDLMGDALERVLASDAAAGLEDHLAECPPCRNYMDQLRLTRKALAHLPPASGSARRRDALIEEFRKGLRADE